VLVGEFAARQSHSTLLDIIMVLASLHDGNFRNRRFPPLAIPSRSTKS